MLIALIIALIFGGGTENLSFADESRKFVKKEIHDDPRRENILSEIEEYEERSKELSKNDKKWDKEWKALINDYNASRSDFSKVNEKFYAVRKENLNQIAVLEVSFRQKLTDNEWNKLLQIVQQEGVKNSRKDKKNWEKFERVIEKIEGKLKNEIDDEKKLNIVLDGFKDLQSSLELYYNEKQALNYQNSEVMISRSAELKSIQMLSETLEAKRNGFIKEMEDFHFILVDEFEEDQFTQISKIVGS